LAKLADVAVGNALISGGVGSAPSYGKIGLATHVSGTLPVANGGTGVTSSTGSGSNVLSDSPTLVTPALGTPSALVGTNITGTATAFTASNVTTNANLTGDVTSVGNATSIAAGVIVNDDINAAAGIVDTKLATISTASKVSNSATTATSANTANAIVARGASGEITVGDVTTNRPSAPTTGYIYWGNSGTKYMGFDGTNIVASVSPSFSITGNAATATTATTANALATGNNYQVNSLGVGTAASGTAGEIRATNNITAYYSDDRFKTNLGNIPDALAKVLTLNGFYYEANELAQSFGYEKILEVGVSAQQVQAVQPEVVAPAPIDENYLTVRYERLVPLLIEAIKELSAKVTALEHSATKLT
jgi:hypothetical protein